MGSIVDPTEDKSVYNYAKNCLVAAKEEREPTAIELEFAAVVLEARAQIESQLKTAAEALSAAEKIADAAGVSFLSEISPLRQTYQVALPEKFDDLSEAYLDQVTKWCYGSSDFYGTGWEHSAIC